MKKENSKEGFFKRYGKFYSKVEDYLQEIGFMDKMQAGKDFTPEELKQLLSENILKYINGKVNQNFVLALGSIIHHGVVGSCQISGDEKEIDEIAGITCLLDDLAIELLRSQKTQKSSKERDQIIRDILVKLIK